MAQKCVHQGCGKEFADPTEKCDYHPGPPIFHEGQKGTREDLEGRDVHADSMPSCQDGSAASLAS